MRLPEGVDQKQVMQVLLERRHRDSARNNVLTSGTRLLRRSRGERLERSSRAKMRKIDAFSFLYFISLRSRSKKLLLPDCEPRSRQFAGASEGARGMAAASALVLAPVFARSPRRGANAVDPPANQSLAEAAPAARRRAFHQPHSLGLGIYQPVDRCFVGNGLQRPPHLPRLYLGMSPLMFGLVDGIYQGAAAIARVFAGVLADRWK